MSKRRAPRPAPPPREPLPAQPPVTRPEWLTLAAILLLAAALRFAYPGRMAIEHFDEGVYASNIFFGSEEGHRYPYRHLYAPPLLPWLIEWGIVFLGPESIAPFLPALILGTATVPLAWWSARCWFGPAPGLAAALLLATSDFHILYSRTALTDAPVAFFILLAVYLYWEALRRGSRPWSAAAGLATALAWWTKYTGWLPLAIAAAGTAAWLLFTPRAGDADLRSRTKTAASCLAVTTLTALAAWSPVLYGLQPHGGYAAVAENHRGYLEPFSWAAHLWEQAGNLAAQSGVVTCIGLGLLAAMIPAQAPWSPTIRVPVALWCGVTAGWAASVVGPAPPLAAISLAALFVELVSRRALSAAPTRGPDDPPRRLAVWLIAAWFAGMLLTTPLYHPYPRLVMPWLVAAMFLAGLWPSRDRAAVEIGGKAIDPAAIFAAAVLLLPATVFAAGRHSDPWFTAARSVPGWHDRTSLRNAAGSLAESLRNDRGRLTNPAVLFVYASPPLFFHLAAELSATDVPVQPVGNLSVMANPPSGVTTYLAMSPPPAPDLPPMAAEFHWQLQHLRQIDEVTIPIGSPSSLVRLDASDRSSLRSKFGSSPLLLLEEILP